MRVYEFERDVLQLCYPAWPHLSALHFSCESIAQIALHKEVWAFE